MKKTIPFSLGGITPTPDLTFKGLSEQFIKIYKSSVGETLDYSRGSVIKLDAFIRKVNSSVKYPERYFAMDLPGAFLGECIKARYGGEYRIGPMVVVSPISGEQYSSGDWWTIKIGSSYSCPSFNWVEQIYNDNKENLADWVDEIEDKI